MKVTASADWRRSIPFEAPMVVADLVPGEATRCVTCGVNSEPLDRSELWAYKHRHPNHHDGFVRFYCRTHTPEPPRAPVAPAPTRAARASAARREHATAVRRPAVEEKPRAMCTDCFVEVSATGICGMCGKHV